MVHTLRLLFLVPHQSAMMLQTHSVQFTAKTHLAEFCTCLLLPNLVRLVTRQQSYGMLTCERVHKHPPMS